MPTPRFSIRVDPETLELWRSAAEAEGLSIAGLIHRRMADPLAGRLVAGMDPPAATPAPRRRKRTAQAPPASVRPVEPRFK